MQVLFFWNAAKPAKKPDQNVLRPVLCKSILPNEPEMVIMVITYNKYRKSFAGNQINGGRANEKQVFG